ncbi:hypothetical protein RB195_009186 [Necator americanus]|uniref:C2H2-type domain-containing protein n=1 Tax=Necator americanus TaxID=51031 RepID=A0ABR1CVK0_NECAM
MENVNQSTCSLCGKKFPFEQALRVHIHQHLLYRKYECGSCTKLFYTEVERDAHCKEKEHFHKFGVKFSPYCELYVNQLLKDAEYIAMYGIDNVVTQRSKSNFACDAAISKLPIEGNINATKWKRNGLHPQPLSNEPIEARNSSTSSEVDRDTEVSSSVSVPQNEPKKSKGRVRMPSGDWTQIELDTTSAISPATQILGEALRTNTPEVRCMICKTMTASEYVMRKDHVSSVHMPKDHTESDYVEILSSVMQKAYPTLTYNDLQCQIGGCRKEYRCQSARRAHVLRIHFQNELNCPITMCSFRSNDFPRINTHLKQDHGLPNGYMSIQSSAVRDQFTSERAKHNHQLTTLVQLAFPCPVPDSFKSNSRVSDASSPGDTVRDLITRLRDKERKFQAAPPNPLRLLSPSSSSDSDSTESENVKLSPQKNEHTSENNVVAKRKKIDSPSSSSSSSDTDNGEEGRSSSLSNHSQRCSATNTSKEKEDETPHRECDIDSMVNNASEKTDTNSESDDEVQVVECVSSKMGHDVTEKRLIDEVVIDDDEIEGTNTPSSSKTQPSPPKQPRFRTLPISGVSVRIDGEHTSTLQSDFHVSPDRSLSRTLPISGVSIRTNSTPIRSPAEIYRKSFSGGGRFLARRHSMGASEQIERRRELARRKFDLAQQNRAQCAARRKRNNGMRKSETAEKLQKGKKVKKEASTNSNQSPCASNAWRGKIKRFSD